VRIGELAARSEVEPTTIRYYERIGLMPPPTRRESGYRDYGEDAAVRLGFIRAAQSVGLSLGEIRETLAFRDRGEKPCRHVAALIERHAAQLRQRIAALQAMQRELERLANKAHAISPEDVPEAAFCHIIEG
jgi:MerR family transcriptional regulator, copper efflux regulator